MNIYWKIPFTGTGEVLSSLIYIHALCSRKSLCKKTSSSTVYRMSEIYCILLCCRAGLSWFAVEPGWYDSNIEGVAQAEANSVARFLYHLSVDHANGATKESAIKRSQDNGFTATNSSRKVFFPLQCQCTRSQMYDAYRSCGFCFRCSNMVTSGFFGLSGVETDLVFCRRTSSQLELLLSLFQLETLR